MTDDRERWALILGASSGMGEATALALARTGYRIVGIHLDFRAALDPRRGGQGRRSTPPAARRCYVNMNAADDEKRAAAIETIRDAVRARAARAGRKPVHPDRHALARVRVARAVHRRRPEGSASIARRWR